MIYTTLNRIRAHSPCASGWAKLLRGLGKTTPDDDALGFDEIMRINGADDALWCLRAEPQHDRLWRMLAVRIARKAQHLMGDPRSLAALDVAERHANGLASDSDLAAAWAAARDAARDAGWSAAGAAAEAAAWSVARAAAWAVAGAAAEAVAEAAAEAVAEAAAWAAAEAVAVDQLLDACRSCHADPGHLGSKK